MKKVFIREDFRRDGLCMNFLVDEKLMGNIAEAFPRAIFNIGYPAICSKEREMCEKITLELSSHPVEIAVVGHALPNHLEIMASIVNSASNTSASFWIPFSDYLIRQTINKRPEQVLTHAKRMAEIWEDLSNRPLDVALVDSTAKEKGSIRRLHEFYNCLKDSGVRSIIVCDTKGRATTKRLTDLLVGFRGTNADLEYHPHNDNGLAHQNIETALCLGVKGIGTGVFGYGERGTMVDARELVAKYKIPYNPEAFKNFRNNYNAMIAQLNEKNPIFTENTVVTGTQYRLRGRDPKLDVKFGVTSDKYILGKKIRVDPSEISDGVLEAIKNDLYTERKRVFSESELKSKYGVYNGSS